MKSSLLSSLNNRNLFKLICLQLFLILILSTLTNAVRFYLHPGTKRCLKEEMRKSVICTGEYELSDGLGQRTDLQITDSKGHSALLRENIDKGKIAVTSDEDDIYDICFTSYSQGHQMPPREVYIDLKHGVEAKNYDEIAAVGKLKPMELELTKLEDLSASIVQDFEHMRKREEEMRDTNESTNTRVFYLGIFSIGCLLGLATWQVLYLRRFFKTKKLID